MILVAIVAVGLQVRLAQLGAAGYRPLVVGLASWLTVAAVSLIVISLL